MPRRQELRPAATDHLAALAARFHPHQVPAFDWAARRWWWVGPDGRREVLGEDWQAAQVALYRLGQRVRCAHGEAITAPCARCRTDVVGQLSGG